MSKMKILYLSNVLSIHDYRFLQKLVHSDYKTFLLTFKETIPDYIIDLPNLVIIHKPIFNKPVPTNNAYNNHERKYKNKTKILLKIFESLNKIKHLQVKLNKDILTNILAFISPLQAYRARKIINKIHPDILHTSWIPGGGLIGALSNFHPHLLMPLGSDIFLLPYKSFLWRQIVRFVIKQADMITCNGEALKKSMVCLTNCQEDKIVAFPWGVNINIFYPNAEHRVEIRRFLDWQDKKILIMTRNFETVYGIEYFIDSLPLIINEVPETRVLFLGSGSLKEKFERLIQKNGVSDKVRFLGYVPNSELPKYLNASDIYVSSSLSDAAAISLVEAMACGLPVVVTDVTGYLELITNRINGFIVPKKDPESLAEKIIFLLQNEEKAREMGKKNLEIARKSADWNRNFEKLEDIYEKLSRYSANS